MLDTPVRDVFNYATIQVGHYYSYVVLDVLKYTLYVYVAYCTVVSFVPGRCAILFLAIIFLRALHAHRVKHGAVKWYRSIQMFE